MYLTKNYIRKNGECFQLQIAIDENALLNHLARTMAMRGKETKRIADGAIVARIV